MKQSKRKDSTTLQGKGLARYDKELWWIDLTGKKWVFDKINPDGTRQSARVHEVSFMDVLSYGPIISRTLPTQEELKALRASL